MVVAIFGNIMGFMDKKDAADKAIYDAAIVLVAMHGLSYFNDKLILRIQNKIPDGIVKPGFKK